MMFKIDLAGRRFGRLVVLRYSDKNDGRNAWVCLCDCGIVKETRGANLRNGKAVSCGCMIRERLLAGLAGTKHGMSTTKVWKTWSAMFDRCMNANNRAYRLYGGRGISICERWKSFANFLEDMGDRPARMTLDRIDGNGNYEPNNCRWATHKQQSNNTSWNRRIEYNGATVTARELSDATGIPYDRLRDRLFKRGWPVEKAITKPTIKRLSAEEIVIVHARIRLGHTQTSIAKDLGASPSLINKVALLLRCAKKAA